MKAKQPNPPSGDLFNEFQVRRLRVTCHYIDRLLSQVEELLNVADSKAAFPRYLDDISPAQRRGIEDHISRIRNRLVRLLQDQGIAPEPPLIPASRAVNVALTVIDIAVEELEPGRMRGYGDIEEAAANELTRIVDELRAMVLEFSRHMAGGAEPGTSR